MANLTKTAPKGKALTQTAIIEEQEVDLFDESSSEDILSQESFTAVTKSPSGKWLILEDGTTAMSMKNVKEGIRKGFLEREGNTVSLTGDGRAFIVEGTNDDGETRNKLFFTDKEQNSDFN